MRLHDTKAVLAAIAWRASCSQASPIHRVSDHVRCTALTAHKSHILCCAIPLVIKVARTSLVPPSRGLRLYAPRHANRSKWRPLRPRTHTRIHVVAEACHRCYNTLGSRYCCCSLQSKSRFAVVAVVVAVLLFHRDTSFTPAAPASPATCTTSTNNIIPLCTAL